MPFTIPQDRRSLVDALAKAQNEYEIAKGEHARLEVEKLSLAEEREDTKATLLADVALQTFPSQAARERAEKACVAESTEMRRIELNESMNRRNMVYTARDVSIARHRLLTLRAALAPEVSE